MADQKIEIELALRDTVSLTLKAIAGNLELVNRKLKTGGEGITEGVDTLHKIKQHTESFGHSAKNTGEAVVGFTGGVMRAVGMLVRTPVGLAAAAAVAAGAGVDALRNAAAERMKLKAMSEDTGLSEDKISIMQRVGGRLGFDREETNKYITNIGNTITNIGVGLSGSEGYRGLVAIGEGAFAEKLTRMSDRDAAVDAVMAEYKRLQEIDPEKAFRFVKIFGTSPSFMKDFEKNARGLVPAYRMSTEAAEKFLLETTNLYTWLDSLSEGLLDYAVDLALAAANILGGGTESPVVQYLGQYIRSPSQRRALGLSPLTEQQTEELEKQSKARRDVIKQIRDLIYGIQNPIPVEKRQAGGSVLPGRDYLVGERGPEMFSSGGRFGLVGEGGPERFMSPEGGLILPGDQIFSKKPLSGGGGPYTAEENWEALNKALKNEMIAPAFPGQAEGGASGGGGRGTDLFGGPLYDSLRGLEKRMERGEGAPWGGPRGFEFWLENRPPRGGWPGERGSEWDAQPINFDRALGGFDGGNIDLGAEISFQNIPPGVETSVDGDGFDDFRVNKTKELENI